jgi:PAS domain S-box-containing protein
LTSPTDAKSNARRERRQRAEAAWRERREAFAAASPEDVARQIQELEVHQIELEFENEELASTNAVLEDSYQRLSDLYDFAPIGYLTIDRDAVILHANVTVAKMLGTEPGMLVGRSLLQFVVGTRWEALDAAQRAAYNASWSGELTLRKPDDGDLAVSIEMVGAVGADGRSSWRCAMTDVTSRHAAERALRASEERYRGLAEQVVDGIFVTDSSGRYIDANDAGCEMLGYTLQELKTLTVRDVIHPEELKRLPEQMRSLASGHILRNEWRLKRKDGSTFEGELVARQLPNGLLQGVVRDLTEQKRSQEALLRRLEFDKFLFELSQTFIGLAEAEVDVNMERGLARAGQFLGMDRVTLLELTRDRTAMTASYAWTAPGEEVSLPAISQRAQPWWIDQVLRGAVSLVSHLDDLPEEAAAEKEYLRQRGVVSAASIPLKVGGEIAGAIGFVTTHRHVTWTDELVDQLRAIGDILWNALNRRRAMEAVTAAEVVAREGEERFQLAMSNVAAGVYTVDLDGFVTYINPAAEAMFGWTNAELRGKNMHNVVHYERPDGTPYPASDCPALHVLQTGIELREHEDMFIRRDGSFFPVVFSASPLKKDGTTVGLVVGIRDDTLRRDAERAVRESEALRASEDRYRGLAEQVVDSIFVADAAGRYVDANSAACELLGYTLEELKTLRIEDVLAADERPLLFAELRRLASGQVVRSEWRFRRKDGTLFTGELVGRRLPDGRLQGVVRDVTERKEAEDVQRRLHHIAMLPLEAKVEDVLMAILDTAIDVAHADFGNIQLLDPKTSTLYIAAQRGFPQWWIDYWETVGEGHGTCGTTLKRGERVVVEDVERSSAFTPTDLDMQRKAGVRAVQSTPLVSRSGERIGMLSTHLKHPGRPNAHTLLLLDLLAREAADIIRYARSEKEQKRQAALLDLANSAIFVHELEGMITYWNGGAARSYGWSKEEALGKISHLLLQTQFPEPLERILEVITRTSYWEGELVHTRRDGAQITVHSRWAILHDAEGEGFGVLEVNDDITGRKAAEQALHRAVAARDEVLGIVAHDLRNPLTSIVHSVELAQRRSESESLAKPLGLIGRAAARMNHLIQSLLDVSLIEAGQLKIEGERVDTNGLVREAVDLQMPLATASGLTLHAEVTPDAGAVWGDRARLHEVFENLIGNAIKFTDRGGRIDVGAASSGHVVQFWVTDTGRGIAPDHLPHVFDRFWQVVPRAGRLSAGLGLAITKGIVEAHGGRIWVESVAGRGSTFFFTIPKAR